MDSNPSAPVQPAPVANPAPPPPPGGGTAVPNQNYQPPVQPTIPPPPGGGTAVPNPHHIPNSQASTSRTTPASIPPPPGGGAPVANPNYVPQTSPSDDSIPAFIRDGVDTSKVRTVVQKPGADDAGTVAEVRDNAPNEIDVFDPSKYDSGRRNHELTHIYQDSRSDELKKPAEVTGSVSLHNDPYDYSGQATSSRALPYAQQMQAKLKGLQKARNSGKTIADFNDEQQAEIVRDYKQQHDTFLAKVKNGTATKKDLQGMSDLQNTYHPFIEQMAKMPNKNVKINPGSLNLLLGRNMPTIDTRPDAPGLPSFATAGMGEVDPDPLMGGKAEPIRHKTTKK